MTRVLLFALAVVGIAGCTLHDPFTHGLRDKYSLDERDLKQIQYFLSDAILLQRELGVDELVVAEGHELKIVRDRRVEEITIPQGTPGVAVGIAPWALEISFEEGSSLTFGFDGHKTDPFERPMTGFANTRKATSGVRYILCVDKVHMKTNVPYGGKTYTVLQGVGAYLEMDMKQFLRLRREARTVEGRKVGAPSGGSGPAAPSTPAKPPADDNPFAE
jgi:hypothetical protein